MNESLILSLTIWLGILSILLGLTGILIAICFIEKISKVDKEQKELEKRTIELAQIALDITTKQNILFELSENDTELFKKLINSKEGAKK